MTRQDSGPLSLLTLIVNTNKSKKIVSFLKESGLRGATIFYGFGTEPQSFWHSLGLDQIRREIIMVVGYTRALTVVSEQLERQLNLKGRHQGIEFMIPLRTVIGTVFEQEIDYAAIEGGSEMFEAIITIVNRDQADIVIEAAGKAGARGGTIIHGRGTADKIKKVFNMEIQPEKEIVLTITTCDKAQGVIDSISNDLNIKEPNNGILFTTALNNVVGVNV